MNAVILAGGKSSRFGSNKILAEIGGLTIIERVVNAIEPIVKKIIIISNELLIIKKVECYADIIKDKGPLAGIYTGLVKSDSFYNFFFAADLPFVNAEVVKYMAEQTGDNDAIVPYIQNKYEPLLAIYSKNCINVIEKQISNDKYKVTDFLSAVKVKKITEDKIKKIDPALKSFFNINTREDYLKALTF